MLFLPPPPKKKKKTNINDASQIHELCPLILMIMCQV